MPLPTQIKVIHFDVAEKLTEVHSNAMLMLEATIFNKFARHSQSDMQRAVKIFMTDQVINPISLEIDKMRIYIEVNSQFLSTEIIHEIEDLRFHLLETMVEVARNARIHLESITGALCEMIEHHCCKEERYNSYLTWRN